MENKLMIIKKKFKNQKVRHEHKALFEIKLFEHVES
jgi:hypothetical protein